MAFICVIIILTAILTYTFGNPISKRQDVRIPLNRVTTAGLIVALGIIYGDIGTSPLYVFNAIINDHKIDEHLIIGSLSCIIWTITLQTTVKYVWLVLRADNRGGGGTFALYALVRRQKKWLVIPAMIGGAALFADGCCAELLKKKEQG